MKGFANGNRWRHPRKGRFESWWDGAVVSHISRKASEIPGFPYAAQARATCAAFIKESRMKFINANRPHRKSGGVGHPSVVANGKSRIERRYPTQANGRLEWGTQCLLPVRRKLLGLSLSTHQLWQMGSGTLRAVIPLKPTDGLTRISWTRHQQELRVRLSFKKAA